MNDFQMIHLAGSRSHDFRREADAQRSAKTGASDQRREARPSRARRQGPRSTLRLTLSYLFGRVAA